MSKSKYVRKTADLWIVQQYTGPQYGWEDVYQSKHYYSDARLRLKEYRENQPEYPARCIRRRESIVPVIIFDQICSRCGARVQIFAHEGNNVIHYTLSDGASMSFSRQYINCQCSAQFRLSAYGLKIEQDATVL